MPTFLPIAFFRNKFCPFEEATLSIATHGLHYGTGALGGLRGLPDPANPKQILLFRLERHCQRLSNSARYLQFDVPTSHIKSVLIDFVKHNRPTEPFYIRPLVYTSDLGIAPRVHDIEHDFAVYGLPLGNYLSPEGITCRISSWQRPSDLNLPLRGKITGGYVNSALAKTEALKSGFDEAILLNAQGKVSEASGMNIFLVRGGQLITPGVDQDVLEGITRHSVIQIAQNNDIPVIERPVDRSELLIADEVFLCGTAARIAPIKRIENYDLPVDRPITDTLQSTLTAIVENREPAYREWVDVIPLD
ncbi:branched-chain amino acid transaminase [Oscillatoria sp. CS-180]|uniref:branched-chain amino acid transaminase n=1 Tax=Oscillatoria sp. CS-180 TaxID=3021720 RepID=UPI00232FE5B9|nr:branched-chain amino acid transaminase [Oscillatoria sp. CS-180]MDB9526207.1 branched-chain amino acid transaminase [Oscillatoria sp. CS-180]